MGGGPRTYPDGVSKWQWKRMQAKKAKQLLKARLCRERQIYEMRKRAELKAAISELERPWEIVKKAPNLFSVSADEQVKVLADRFQRPGGFDMWSERDGPQLFETPDGIPSARFFPKGVVHSIKPYEKISGLGDSDEEELNSGLENENQERIKDGFERKVQSGELTEGNRMNRRRDGKFRKKMNRSRHRYGSSELDLGQVGFNRKQREVNSRSSGSKSNGRINERERRMNSRNANSEIYDMRLQRDGTYGFQSKSEHRKGI
ncbi:hypothetical protein K2173_008901 [Erythroxylum novogranatense]|uniref:DEAD-box ATP-dependent RNA helicase 48 n=1 Tax=Erythroxylum novogranatense TaxID=1862640 RepID=A0AAV8S4J8_9ROSI|nr:hypothetical protein K2173_008901 [Erythroxylum novogranatense]